MDLNRTQRRKLMRMQKQERPKAPVPIEIKVVYNPTHIRLMFNQMVNNLEMDHENALNVANMIKNAIMQARAGQPVTHVGAVEDAPRQAQPEQ
jgi:hypothetical protein